MAMGDKGWSDRTENYADSWTLRINGTTATAVNGQEVARPTAVYALTVTVNPAVGSGDVVLVDGSATGDAADTRKYTLIIASAASQVFAHTIAFPRGLVFDTGLIVSATTVSGAVSLEYKPRYA